MRFNDGTLSLGDLNRGLLKRLSPAERHRGCCRYFDLTRETTVVLGCALAYESFTIRPVFALRGNSRVFDMVPPFYPL